MIQRISKRDRQKRLVIIICLLGLAIFGLSLRFGYLQMIKDKRLSRELITNVYSVDKIKTPRGKIVDRNGSELAVSIMVGSLYADPIGMEDPVDKEDITKPKRDVRRLAAQLLAPVIGVDEEKLHKQFSTPKSHFLWIKRDLEPKVARRVKKIIEDKELPGINLIPESRRYYTKKKTAAQLLGFVGDEDTGREGLEYQLDKYLKGSSYEKTYALNARGKRLFVDEDKALVEVKLPTAYLTIDSHMQYVLEQAIDDAVKNYNAEGAAAIIMDPYTGEILSMVSRPTFDPNEYYKYSPESWRNKGVGFIYEPGSVFKPIVGCIGMTKEVVSPDTIFNDQGNIRVADRVYYNWDGEGGGMITFTDVIKNSVNTGMIMLGKDIGKKAMVQGALDFGFGKPTGVDIPGEQVGLLYDEDMYDPDLASFSIGQGIAVTPLQELRAICAIANGGELVRPYVIQKIVDGEGKVLKEGKKVVVRNVITENIARQMRMMMEKVVSEGGGKKAAIQGYRIAGKTGTAQKKADNGVGYAEGKYIASFVGFVPADKPKYAMLVLVDTPKGNRFYGSQVAAPIFKDVLQQILVLKGIQPNDSKGLVSLDTIHNQSNNMTKGQTKWKIADITVLPGEKLKLPDFKGGDVRTITELLTKHKLRIRPYGGGKAYLQNPAPGMEVEPGRVIEVWFQ